MPDYAELARASQSAAVNTGKLAAALSRNIRGEVRFDNGTRALYATDGSNYRHIPLGVVLPRDNDDVIATLALAHELGAPVLCRGGGTSLAGQCCNVALVLDFSKYMANILEIDPVRRIARVQPGVILDHLRNAAEKYHLTFGPDCVLVSARYVTDCGGPRCLAGTGAALRKSTVRIDVPGPRQAGAAAGPGWPRREG